MNTAPEPAMSVILACAGQYDDIRMTVRHLRAQTPKPRLELVIIAPSADALNLDEGDMDGFWGHQIVEYPAMRSIARANAAGVRCARAGIVALAEDHCFPEPEWAAALIERHREPWAAVGPVILNANPTSMVSWCDYLVGYSPWSESPTASEVDFLPGHNSSYKRDVLLEYGNGLEDMLEAETVLHIDLRRRGYRLLFEPAARSAHVNIGLLSSWLPIQFHNGRTFGGTRALNWSWGRRLFYSAASPLIPFVRLWRIARRLPWSGQLSPRPMSFLPLLLVGLACDGLGQMCGYLLGVGQAGTELLKYEFRRIDHVTAHDRAGLNLPNISHGDETRTHTQS